jgi:hypothetical protein
MTRFVEVYLDGKHLCTAYPQGQPSTETRPCLRSRSCDTEYLEVDFADRRGIRWPCTETVRARGAGAALPVPCNRREAKEGWMNEFSAGAGPGAVRLVIEYEGRQLRLVSTRRVDTLAPATDPLDSFEGRQGLWAEVRDGTGRVLHRQVMADPIGDTVEVFDDVPGGAPRRVPSASRRGTFMVLIPDLADAEHLAVMDSPGGTLARTAAAEATELARFPLTDRPGAS